MNATDSSPDRILVDASALEATVTAIFESCGFSQLDAARSARVLVTADLRGVESHGVSNMLRRYLAWLDSGNLNPRPQVSVVSERPSAVAYDADAGLGVTVLPILMDETIQRAKTYGIAMASVRNARHSGMLAYHTMLASDQDMIGVCGSTGGPRVLPTFGAEARLGTNPLSVSFPSADDHPFLFDAATSTVAFNKIENARREGALLGAGWCADGNGRPAMSPIPSDSDVDEAMLPLGSAPELGSHKGYALSCIIEILASILPGGTFMGRLGHGHNAHFLMAIDPAAFSPLDEFKTAVSEFAAYLRDTPPSEPGVPVLTPNDLEAATMAVRSTQGIPVHREVIDWFDQTCRQRKLALLQR